MNVDDRQQLDALKSEINKDIALAISSFKVWLMATVLSNVILIGIPALFVFFTTQNTSAMAYDLAKDNQDRLNERSDWIDVMERRVTGVEDHLSRTAQYEPPGTDSTRPR